MIRPAPLVRLVPGRDSCTAQIASRKTASTSKGTSVPVEESSTAQIPAPHYPSR